MKHQKTIEVPAETKVVTDFITCDICHEKINDAPGSYDVDEITIQHRFGVAFPDGGNWEEVTIDLCSNCFETKLIPWVQTFGGEPSRIESSW